MKNIYLYHDSFDSLLLLIFTLIDKNIKPDDIKNKFNYQNNLIDNFIDLKIYNDKLIKNYFKKLSYKLLIIVYKVYLSNNERKELIIYYFIKNALIYKNNIFNHKYLNCVILTIKISKYVHNEAHKLKGFLRFRELKNGVYYAKMEPTNNVIFLISNHFKKRFLNERFLIEDVKRKIFAFYDKDKLYYLNKNDILNLKFEETNNEIKFNDLWKSFFNSIGIKERNNYKVQRNFMPKKYWKYITEMEDNL